MRKPDFYQCENKGADQLCSNCTADQRLCFRYTESTIPQDSRFLLWVYRSVCVGPGPKYRFPDDAAHIQSKTRNTESFF